MSTLGTIVDILTRIPDAVGPLARLVERLAKARPEDRAAIIAAMEEAAARTHDAVVRATGRLADSRRADEPTQPAMKIADAGEATDPRQKG